MTLSHQNSNLDNTIPADERYPMMRSLVDDLERYLNPATHTPDRHEPVTKTRRFYIIDDNVYVGESLSNELAARRNAPLCTLEDCATYPHALYNQNSDDCSFVDFLAESQSREVVLCIADITTIPSDAFHSLAEILQAGEFDPSADAHQPLLDDSIEYTPVNGSKENLIVLASEPSNTFLDDICDDICCEFGVQVNPDEHDGYTNSGFTRLD